MNSSRTGAIPSHNVRTSEHAACEHEPGTRDQITAIDNYITRGGDGILLAANDPVAIAPVMKKALAAGINVARYDANSGPDARQWFVNQAELMAMINNSRSK